MPRNQLNAYQLELCSQENKARVKKIAATNQRIFKLAEQSDLERRRLCRLALEQKLGSAQATRKHFARSYQVPRTKNKLP
jgi:hypothetical protein